MDNDKVYYSHKILDLINKSLIKVLYTSPYFPYLNSVEFAFNFLKKEIKKK